MSIRKCVWTIGMVAGSCMTALAQPSYSPISPGIATGISSDGRVVVGIQGNNLFTWTVGGGGIQVVTTGLTSNTDHSPSISGDGQVVCGNFLDTNTSRRIAGRWSQSTGWEGVDPIGAPNGTANSSARAISFDGSVIVGRGTAGTTNRALRWDPVNGSTELEPSLGANNEATGVSYDGTIAVGSLTYNVSPSARGVVWINSVTNFVDANNYSICRNVNGPGTRVIGRTDAGAIVWEVSNGTITLLQNIPGPAGSFGPPTLIDISDDGNVIVGTAPMSQFPGGDQAFIWTPAGGSELLRNYLAARGVTGMPATLLSCTGVSADGRSFTGRVTQFPQASFHATLGPLCVPDYNMDGGADNADIVDLANDIASGTQSYPPNVPDFNGDGSSDNADVVDLANTVASGTCP